jgi:Regulator of ribonuclease activity B
MFTTSVIVVIAVVVLGAAYLFFRGGGEAAPDVGVLSQLRQAGSDLSKPHAIEFFMYFPNEASANSVASKLQSEGFSVKVSPSASGESEWLALATKSMVPAVAELVRLRGKLTAMSVAEKGTYDGWGTPVVK